MLKNLWDAHIINYGYLDIFQKWKVSVVSPFVNRLSLWILLERELHCVPQMLSLQKHEAQGHKSHLLWFNTGECHKEQIWHI